MLRLSGRRCVVVGGGRVAARKIGPLLDAGAVVLVVAPECAPGIEQAASEGRVALIRRPYQAGDLQGADLAFAATDSRAVNARVADDADALGVRVNVADDPARSSFQVPSAARCGDVTLAVSTGGRSPAFARRLRQELEQFLTPERLALLELYAELRGELIAAERPTAEAAWDGVDCEALRLLRAGRRVEALDLVRASVAGSRQRD
jgi:precorrin-2 dehydrogenase/sirohydrochlorin ferrochelatase